ncbi:MAG: glycosyltransferase [Acidobacteria bacterium]|nr:MAG: glycosyltransferase [Acidobacteriota bacterium]
MLQDRLFRGHDPALLSSFPNIATRPAARGKFLFAGDEKLYLRGTTYGPFRPNNEGCEYHDPDVVERDVALMQANEINAIRLYTVPPVWLLDLAQAYGLRVLVGLPWEQHVTFLDEKKRARDIEERVRAGVRSCSGHPAMLGYAIGNEIPASIVRWFGHRRVERFLARLYRAAKDQDPGGLVTYMNYPTTEYLQPACLDFVCFNVFLEQPGPLAAYLARLQNLAGDKPLVVTEIGLDSRRNGEKVQADTLRWQIRTVFEAGCSGAFVFSWTDEWHRGGQDITDWDFGLTDRARRPKRALVAVREAFQAPIVRPEAPLPRISVVVCSYNGSRTLHECCQGLRSLDYPDLEVIVVNDGSTDQTAAIAEEHSFRVIRTENEGLSRARNTGLRAATGEIIAYLDDDTVPDPQWLNHLAIAFRKSNHAGIGGPNLTPAGDSRIAECISNAPGNPIHVLLSDHEAEHIPGCNMAFRKAALEAIGGFDPQFRIAGDDVDVCWRLLQNGQTLGFSAGAVVWHHRRNSVKAFWRQQVNYGKAEAMLEMKWPEKYNSLGHLTWGSSMYGSRIPVFSPLRRWRIYYGVWGTRLFQSVYEAAPGTLFSLPLMPEWYLVIAGLALFTNIGLVWPPLLWAFPLLLLAVGVSVLQAGMSAAKASFSEPKPCGYERLKLFLLTGFLHQLQPLARLVGRASYGLTPWRRRKAPYLAFPWPRSSAVWNEHWQSTEQRLSALETFLRDQGAVIQRGGDFDRWDLGIRGGLFGSVRIRMAIEEHGGGRQMVRFRSWPLFSRMATASILFLAFLAVLAGADYSWGAALFLGLIAVCLTARALGDCAAATASHLFALKRLEERRSPLDGHDPAESELCTSTDGQSGIFDASGSHFS